MTKSTTAASRAPTTESQSERFKRAARELECDKDEDRWDERLRKIAGQKPTGEKPV